MPINERVQSSQRSSFDPIDETINNVTRLNTEHQIDSSSSEVRPDRVTTSERNLLHPKEGEVIYNVDLGENEYWNGSSWIGEGINAPAELDSRIIVNQANVATTLGGAIDSSKEYFIDGVVNMGSLQIKVPVGGIQIRGYSFTLSGLITDTPNHVLFVNEQPTCGSVVIADLYIVVSGASSEVYGLINDGSGFFVNSGMAYYDCTSLGQLIQFQQGLEENVTKVGGRPFLVLSGEWDGWKADSVLIRNLDIQMDGALYREGSILSFKSRFIIDASVDLPMLASFIDFTPANFVNASSFRMTNCIITRGGVVLDNDNNVTPNLPATNVKSNNTGCVGSKNTFRGIELNNAAEATTTISVVNNLYDLAGQWETLIPVHFEQSATNVADVKHLGNDINEFIVTYDMTLECSANRELALIFVKTDKTGGNPVVVSRQKRTVNNLSGGRDVAFFSRTFDVVLSKDEELHCHVANLTDTNNVTAEEDSYFLITGR